MLNIVKVGSATCRQHGGEYCIAEKKTRGVSHDFCIVAYDLEMGGNLWGLSLNHKKGRKEGGRRKVNKRRTITSESSQKGHLPIGLNDGYVTQ